MANTNIIADIHEVTRGCCALSGKKGEGVVISIPSAGIEKKFVRWPELKRVLQANASFDLLRQLGDCGDSGLVN